MVEVSTNKGFYYPWLGGVAGELESLLRRGQLPHAILVHGPAGTGRRQLALWLCTEFLGASAPPDGICGDPDAPIAVAEDLLHPDLLVAQPPPDKRTLPIEQVRQLIRFLQLTAHQGHGKAVLITPAESLSHAAANSLLKTLEEPPPGTLMVLVASAPGRLPPTVLSRCHRLHVALPLPAAAAGWLRAQGAEGDPAALLALGGGAPLTALRMQRDGFGAEADRLEGDLVALQRGEALPVAVARRWVRLGTGRCLDWLYRRTAREIRHRLGSAQNAPTESLQIGADVLNITGLFAVLRELGNLRRLDGSGLNMELALAELLDGWYGAGEAR